MTTCCVEEARSDGFQSRWGRESYPDGFLREENGVLEASGHFAGAGGEEGLV